MSLKVLLFLNIHSLIVFQQCMDFFIGEMFFLFQDGSHLLNVFLILFDDRFCFPVALSKGFILLLIHDSSLPS